MKDRILKFRAWDKQEQIMCPVEVMSYIQQGTRNLQGGCFLIGNSPTPAKVYEDYISTEIPKGHFVYFTDLELLQYTGLKDKNGKEIYEGDIVSHFKRLYEVTINFNGYYLQRYKLWRGKFCPSQQYSLSLFTKPDGKVESCEVIGNIYENPELIEKQLSLP